MKNKEKSTIEVRVSQGLGKEDASIVAKAIQMSLSEMGMEAEVEFSTYEDDDDFQEHYPHMSFVKSFNVTSRKVKIKVIEE